MAELAVPVALMLVQKVIIFINQKFNHPSNIHADVEKAQNWLGRMQAYLMDSSKQIDEATHVLQNRVKEVQDIACDIEDVLEEFMLQVPHHFHSHRLSKTMHEISHSLTVKKASSDLSCKIEDIERRLSFVLKLDAIIPYSVLQEGSSRTGDYNLNTHHQVLEEDEMVGFKEPKEKLIKHLMETNSRTIISIVGPGGSGKTTIVKNVYESKIVQGFFHCHAWIDVSRPLKLEELLLNILSIFEPQRLQESVLRRGENDLEDNLRLLLQNKRFLIVLDNVWSKQDLECIVNALPNGLHGSKIIITTRKSDVASLCVKSSDYIHKLGGLSAEKAYDLFCKKAFQSSNGKCPPELEEWADNILKKCGGLPLAISAVGILLANKPQTPVEWKKLHDGLGFEIRPHSNLSIISRILQPSYRDLPSNLKSCFLYFSIFPEDYSIRRERLIRLWVAEGFVTPRIPTTMEEVAEGYLNELIGRNLVHVSSREIDGRVRSCCVLNLVREFILSKAENFVTVLQANCRSPGEKIRRLSVHNVGINVSRDRELNRVRTLLLFGQTTPHISELEVVLKSFKFLRVLDLQGVPLEEFPNSVLGLTLLRYISLRQTNIKTIPKSIKKLGFLETLDLKQTQVTNLPAEIYALHNLRHLLVYRYNVTNYVNFGAARGVEVSAGNIAALSSIQKLTLIKVKNNRKIITALGELKGLRKLGLVDLERKDGCELCCSVQKMQSLSTFDIRSTSEEEYLDLDQMQSPPRFLQRLYLKGRLERIPQWIPLLHSVTKIGLKWSKLNANEKPLQALQALPNLMELDLVQYYTGEVLEFKAETFKKLKILRIEQFDQLNLMVVENGAMPKLKKLNMSKCQSLKLLPVGMEYLKKLDELVLYDMHNDFIAKLQKNGEDRQVVEHIRVIHSFNLGTNQSFSGFHNLS